jgi:hypothetical protein
MHILILSVEKGYGVFVFFEPDFVHLFCSQLFF